MNQNQAKFALIFFLILLFIRGVAHAEVLKPQDTSQFKKTSVRVVNKNKNSGGTGSILRSSNSGSTILTNKHVCRLIEQGGYVEQNERYYDVVSYKKFVDHDLCLIKIEKNFGINLSISKKMAKPSSTVFVSGHPNLLPHILTKGHLSDSITISLIIGVKPCKEKTLECLYFGGDPVVKEFESQVVSNLIKPGSSGSAVFNSEGEIVGVIFAGSGRDFSYGFIVPQKYILYFLAFAEYTDFVPVGTEVDDNGLQGRVFNYSKCKKVPNKKIKRICKKIQDNMIWRK